MIYCADEGTYSAPSIDLVRESREETPLESPEFGEALNPTPQQEMQALLKQHKQVFSNQPGLRDKTVQSIEKSGPRPAPSRADRAKREMQKQIPEHVESIPEMGVIIKSKSPWASPILMVPNKDKTMTFGEDHRKLNIVSQPDPDPTPRIEDLLGLLGMQNS